MALSIEEFMSKHIEPDRIKFLGAEVRADLEEMIREAEDRASHSGWVDGMTGG